VVIALTLFVSGWVLSGCKEAVTVNQQSTQSIPVPKSPRLIVQNFNGKIDIEDGQDSQVRVDITKIGTGQTEADAKADLKNIELVLRQDQDEITIITQHKDDRPDDGSEARLHISIPVSTILNVTNGKGDINFQGTLAAGAHSFKSGKGSIQIYLPSTLSFALNALSGDGKIMSDFDIFPSGQTGENILNGTRGMNPAVSITAATSKGSIAFHQMK
jgi:hypothetical protein